MSSRYPSLKHVALALAAAWLAACSTPGAPGPGLVEIPISGERGKDFVSPCVGRDVSSLNGIPRGRLIDALGPARLCITSTEVNFPEKSDCPTDQDPLWSFYRHADSIDMGGGPELVCVANNTRSCVTVEWRRTK